MSVLLEPLRALLNMITSLINGLIVASLHFILNLLDGLDDVDLLLDHTVDSVKNFFTAFLDLGTSLFPFIPAEWLTIIEAALVILAIGVIIKRRVYHHLRHGRLHPLYGRPGAGRPDQNHRAAAGGSRPRPVPLQTI